MIVINSAAYVVSEFRTEFGRIPPCLLPLGNKKLLEYQVSILQKHYGERVIVSLPDDYELNIDEHNLFESLNIEPVLVPVGLSLAEALLYVLNVSMNTDETLRLLHGDTLIDQPPNGADIIAVAASQDDYNWESVSVTPSQEIVWCGYFAFSSSASFIRCLALARGDFVNAVKAYATERKVIRQEVDGWHDLGHVNTYYLSRSRLTTQRAFNSLRISDGLVWKSGTPAKKIVAEAEWFTNIPAKLRRYTPQLIDTGVDYKTDKPFYQLEYLPCAPLNEVFVHGRNPEFYWKRIFGLLDKFLFVSRSCFNSDNCNIDGVRSDAFKLYQSKTLARLEAYSANGEIDINSPRLYAGKTLPSLRKIAKECIDKTLELPIIPAVMHGDLCFSNILFDSRGASIKVLDPRGLNQSNEFTIYGDQKYDLSKVCHSVIGLYDFIIAGRYQICSSPEQGEYILFSLDKRLLNIQEMFLDYEFVPGVSVRDTLPLTVLLFLSMLPLHADRPDRQKAMLINALRLYVEHVSS